MTPENLIQENERRKEARACVYDPLKGRGCYGERVEVRLPASRGETVFVPRSMIADDAYRPRLSRLSFDLLRMKHDFEFWCAACVVVKDKTGYADIPLVLNRPQRRIFAALESRRVAGLPMRLILLKARQCGGSTVVQMYMAWIQLLLRDNWHSLICAHVKDAAATIKGMMAKLLANYPERYLPAGEKCLKLRSFEGSRDTFRIGQRNNTLTINSAENQATARGKDLAMAHLSEAAFWRTSAGHDPNDVIRSVAGSIALADHTLLVVESTANGTGNFFHEEWLRAVAGKSDKSAVFVPWHESEIYVLPVADAKAFWETADSYELHLWDMGLTLEQIAWYRAKSREYASRRAMQAEYPTTPDEAFSCTDKGVFDADATARLRQDCREPLATGEISGDAVVGMSALHAVRFSASSTGQLKIWSFPKAQARYVVVVDIGGRSESSDYSVIAVVARAGERQRPEVVAQWRGHTDHDFLAWKAAQIACYYNRALLVIESNTIETERTEGDNSGFILDEIADAYPNMYYRQTFDKLSGRCVSHIGFHTNRSTKPLIVNRHIACVRDGGYVERDNEAVNEHLSYERKPNGSFGAKEGRHDDILMTRCIGLFVIEETSGNANCDVAALKRPASSKKIS